MANTNKTGTILIREGALLPESSLIESEPASRCHESGKTATHSALSSASFGMAWSGASTFRWTQTGDTLGALLSSA